MTNDSLWSRGFILSNEEITTDLPENWNLIDIQDWKFWFDSKVDVGYENNNNGFVLIYGDVVSPEGMETDIGEIAKNCLNKMNIIDNKRTFNNYYFNLVGRFILLYSQDGKTWLRQDAGGSRSVFYMENSHKIITSHLDVLTKCLNLDKKKFSFLQKESYSRGVKYFPGNVTPRFDAVQLTPNLDLCLENSKTTRFFPCRNLPEYSKINSEIKIVKLLQSVVELFIKKHHEPLISLTAGVDSRLTCSVASKFNRSVKFFTYYNSANKKFEIDLLTSRYIAKKYDLNHHELDREIEESMDINSTPEIKRNSFLNNGKKLCILLADTFQDNDLHIRSNMGEIGRSVFRRNHGDINIRGGKDMCKIWKPGLKNDEECNKIFEKFYSERWANMNPYDLDSLDLFYWEHRMGIWHSNALNESDIAFGTVNLFSSHEIIELLLSFPLEMRISNQSFHSLIQSACEGMEDIPFNSKLT